MKGKRYKDASTEPLDIIRANECESLYGSLVTRRFQALWNEIERLRALDVAPPTSDDAWHTACVNALFMDSDRYQIFYEIESLAKKIAADRTPSPSSHVMAGKFALGDRVCKTKGSSWHGRVVGFYRTELTPIGYAIESEREPGSVQIYPEAALSTATEGSGE